MKKFLSLLMAFAMIMSLAACGSSSGSASADSSAAAEPAATEDAAPAEEAEPAADDAAAAEDAAAEPAGEATYKLTMATVCGVGTTQGDVIQAWADKINELTNGQVEIEIYGVGTLVIPPDMYSAVEDDLVDIGMCPVPIFTDTMPLTNLLTTMFLNLGDHSTIYENVYKPLAEAYPEITDELHGMQCVAFYATNNGGVLHTVDKAVRVPSDAEGMVLQASTSYLIDLSTAIGASPTTMSNTEWYSSLEKGLLDGTWCEFTSANSLSLFEVTQYHTYFSQGTDTPINMFLMNGDVWNSLPEDIQQVFLDQNDWFAEQMAATEGLDDAIAAADEAGEVLYLTEEEEAAWHEAAAPVTQAQLDKLDGEGYPATDIYNKILELAAANGATN